MKSLALLLMMVVPVCAALEISADFPGGNIVVDAITADTVRLHQDRRDTEGWWFYWCFEVHGAAGRTLHFEFTDGEPIGVRGPAISLNAGKTWSWMGHTSSNSSFSYSFGETADEVRFAFTIPYTQADLDDFLADKKDEVRREQLCLSTKGREVECLHLGKHEARYCVTVTSRHHACESMASFAVEGFIQQALACPWLRDNADILIVPFVDKDGVERGDQGKNRRPHDHNRDYDGAAIYPETQALRAYFPTWSHGRPNIALDLHCPWIRGGTNEYIYQVGSSSDAVWAEQQLFAAFLEKNKKGPLPYRAVDDIPFGKEWNTSKNFSAGTSFTGWTASLPNVRLASSIEIPYANVRGAEVTAETARLFGRDVARGLDAYLRMLNDK